MAQPFRFLDLPKELRLMIYKFLSINATHQSCFPPDIGRLHFVHHALCGVRILETSRQINEEAKAILGPRLEKIKSQPVQLVANPLDLYTIFPRDVILCLGLTHIYWPEQCQLDIRKVAQQFRYLLLLRYLRYNGRDRCFRSTTRSMTKRGSYNRI